MNWKNMFLNLAQLLLGISAGITVLGAFGAIEWRLDLISHFVAWQSLGTLVAMIALWAIGARRWAVGAAVLLLIQASQPLIWYRPVQRTDAQESVLCRILLANVLSTNPDKQSVLDLIEALDPDIICIQETKDTWAEALEVLHDKYPAHHIESRRDNFGIAVYSRVSPDLPETVFQDSFAVPAMVVPIEIDGVKAQLLNIHAVPPMGAKYSALRWEQLVAAREWHEAQTEPSLIVGDLNLTMYSPVYRRWMAGFNVKNARQGHGPLGSWPVFVPFLRLPIDQCLVSPEIEVVDCRLGPNIGSDHLPLIVDLRLPQ